MHIKTQAFTFDAPVAKVFGFLSNIDNLPAWAIHFCKDLRREGDRHIVTTPAGDLLLRLEADAKTGVIDFVAGPDETHLERWPSRLVPLGESRALWLFTAIQSPGVPDSEFDRQCQLLIEESEVLRRRVEPAPITR
jgi:hypothetical protein